MSPDQDPEGLFESVCWSDRLHTFEKIMTLKKKCVAICKSASKGGLERQPRVVLIPHADDVFL